LARDIKLLETGGYKLKKVQPVDMFPWSVHCEVVCLLQRTVR
jgi:23S rRNA (uracil1939-C5)-methyltransferase